MSQYGLAIQHGQRAVSESRQKGNDFELTRSLKDHAGTIRTPHVMNHIVPDVDMREGATGSRCHEDLPLGLSRAYSFRRNNSVKKAGYPQRLQHRVLVHMITVR